jgi:hypothetical protein
MLDKQTSIDLRIDLTGRAFSPCRNDTRLVFVMQTEQSRLIQHGAREVDADCYDHPDSTVVTSLCGDLERLLRGSSPL